MEEKNNNNKINDNRTTMANAVVLSFGFSKGEKPGQEAVARYKELLDGYNPINNVVETNPNFVNTLDNLTNKWLKENGAGSGRRVKNGYNYYRTEKDYQKLEVAKHSIPLTCESKIDGKEVELVNDKAYNMKFSWDNEEDIDRVNELFERFSSDDLKRFIGIDWNEMDMDGLSEPMRLNIALIGSWLNARTTEKQKIIIIRKMKGQSQEQIAKELGITKSAVSKHVNAVLKKFEKDKAKQKSLGLNENNKSLDLMSVLMKTDL